MRDLDEVGVKAAREPALAGLGDVSDNRIVLRGAREVMSGRR
jgi:hypothetical protein